MIAISNLRKTYGTAAVVDGLTFTVRPGRVTGFLGRNGAGKTTTLRMLLGLCPPSAGTALIGGRRYRDLPRPLCQVGALLDDTEPHGGHRAEQHLRWLARTHRLPARRVPEVLAATGLEEQARTRVRALSLGMRRRLGIAAALLGDPATLVLDEPGNGLDAEGTRWLRGLLKGLAAEGRTVLVSSHLMGEMALTADHVVVIGRGRLLADSPTAELLRTHSGARVRVRTPEPERLLRALAGAGIEAAPGPDGALRAYGVPAARVGEVAAAAGVPLHEVVALAASLEEAFLRLTGDDGEHGACRPDGADGAGEGVRR
ncbi:ATP-binding cassette domain-containing protein [Streptomyces sp. 7-21]|uniref:ABC transporter ATP-binding protein n=1 Tax=Streptomyces sp. 7-21 TaxID=2802283 RepID=UPI0027DD6A02|nr:ATP-binding cassette domain-containing protein [Streptomyces sp. 7-21]